MNGGNPIALPTPRPAGFLIAHDGRFLRGRASTVAAVLCLALLGVLMGLAALRLFAGITTVGMTGVDQFYYWGVANDLLHGNYFSDAHRLSLYALYALCMKVLGANDYAIRAFVGGLAVLNIALVYLLAQGIARNAAIALAAAALYAVNPVVMLYAGTELPHMTGATFVLICSLLSLPATDRSADLRLRLAASLLMGASMSAAALTHEDLAFLGIGYFIVLALPLAAPRVAHAPSKDCRHDVALNAGAFALGVAVAAGSLMLAFRVTPWRMVHDALGVRADLHTNARVPLAEFFATVPLRVFKSITVDSLGNFVTGLLAVAVVIAPIAYVARRCEELRRLLVLAIPLVVYLVGFLLIGRVYLASGYHRLLLPLLGPTLVFALCGAYLLLRSPWRQAAAAVILAWSAYVVIGDRPWYFDPPAVSAYRQLYDALKDRVTSQHKLLLPACFAIDFPYVGIGSDVYLGSNVVPIYLLQHFVSLDALIAANRVGYVFAPDAPQRGVWPRERIEQLFRDTYGVAMDRAMLEALPRLSQDLWRGDTRVQWTGAACAYEAQVLRQLLDRQGAHVAVTVDDLGDVYELAR